MPTLVFGGDVLERVRWSQFISSDLPSYETFWQRHVEPLTKDGRFMTDAELKEMGKSAHDICVAQLHYTVLVHLSAAYDLRQVRPMQPFDFTHCVIRLVAAVDVADELLQRMKEPGTYDPWSDEDGRKARNKWRASGATKALADIREYRNHLTHGRAQAGLTVEGHEHVEGHEREGLFFPRVGSENEYQDWRKATEKVTSPEKLLTDFDTGNSIANQAWRRVVDYLQSQWVEILA